MKKFRKNRLILGLFLFACLPLIACIDESYTVDFTKLAAYKKHSLPPQSTIQDLRIDLSKKFRKIPKGMGYYLGDSQSIPNRITLFQEYLASENIKSEVQLNAFDILLISDSGTPGNFDEFLGTMGNAVGTGIVTGLTMGAVAKVTGTTIDPATASNLAVNGQIVENNGRIKHSIIAYLNADISGQRVELVKTFGFNIFVWDDDAEIREVTYKCLNTLFSEWVTKYRSLSSATTSINTRSSSVK